MSEDYLRNRLGACDYLPVRVGENFALVTQRNVVARPLQDSNLLQFSSTPGMSTYVCSFIPFVGNVYSKWNTSEEFVNH